MHLRQMVEDYSGVLSPSEQTVIREVLRNPAEAAFLSAAELAERSGVHAATVVRLAQKLGYEGYPEMRSSLAAEVVSQQAQGPAERVRRSLERTPKGDVLSSLIESEFESLSLLRQHVSQEQLEGAAKLLHNAEQIYLFGSGHSMALVELLDRRLRRSGHQTVDLRFQGRELAERLLTLSKKDVVLAFALRNKPKGLSTLLNYAHGVGAPTVLVADVMGPLVRPQPSLLLSAPRGDESGFQTLTVPMTIVNALVLTLAQRDEGRSIEALNHLDGLIAQFEEEQ